MPSARHPFQGTQEGNAGDRGDMEKLPSIAWVLSLGSHGDASTAQRACINLQDVAVGHIHNCKSSVQVQMASELPEVKVGVCG